MSRFTINFDGGARPNPGPAAIGVVLRDADGKVVEAVGEKIGEATNNIAEYRALLRGIELAVEHGATDLEVIGDSQLVVRQIEGAYKVKKPQLKPLHEQALSALAELDNWEIRHVMREENAAADDLAGQALANA